MSRIVPVILSGGAGTRLWPLSDDKRPKQFLPLVTDRTMLQETALRVADKRRFAAPLVVCNAAHRFLVAEQLRAVGAEPQAIILEPVGRNTAPAIALAALWLGARAPAAIMLVLPSDHVIADTKAFVAATQRASAAAAAGHLVTFGIRPTTPETGYGYIQAGPPLPDMVEVRRVARFVEKPDRAAAEAYLASGDYSWNSGMFVLPVAAYLSELEKWEPEILRQCRAAHAGAVVETDFLRVDADAFAAAPAVSVDYAVMERTALAATVMADIGWSDVGSWAALWEIADKDDRDSATAGKVVSVDSAGCYLRSDGPLIATAGLRDLVVIATRDAVLVVPRDQSQRVRDVVAALKERQRG